MKRIRLRVAYDGTNYCGWQIQPNGITIEEVLNKAITKLTKVETAVIGASRTDSGVHARWEMWQCLIQNPPFRRNDFPMH